jgi:hypothetical protein
MRTAISDDEARLLNMAQRDFDQANRLLFAAETAVARVLKISHSEAAQMLNRHALDRELQEAGVEIYQAAECRSPWPDKTTLGVWVFMVTGAFYVTWLAGVVV